VLDDDVEPRLTKAQERRTMMRLCVLVGVQDAAIAGDVITGHWSTCREVTSPPLNGGRRTSDLMAALLDFVNSRDDERAILNFVLRWGPLTSRWGSRLHSTSQHHFEQSLGEWRTAQLIWKQHWEARTRMPILDERHPVDAIGGLTVRHELLEGDGFMWDFHGCGPALQLPNLQRAIVFQLSGIRLTLLRRCANPECLAPLFIANRTTQLFCCKDCAASSTP